MYTHIHIMYTRSARSVCNVWRLVSASKQGVFLEGTRGSQGMGVVSSSWFDIVLVSIVYMFKPSCGPMLKPPSL